MSLRIDPLTEADVDTYVAIRHAAFEGSVNRIFYNRPVSDEGKSQIAAQTLKSLREDPTLRFLKVTDVATGEIISCAKWQIPLPEVRIGYAGESSSVPQPIAECNLPAWTAFFTMLHEAKQDLMGDRSCYFLDLLVTHPNHHRRGAGKMLIEWGLEKADQDGLEVYVEGTAMATPLYAKHNFKVVKKLQFDLSNYGGRGIHVQNCMIREPQGIRG